MRSSGELHKVVVKDKIVGKGRKQRSNPSKRNGAGYQDWGIAEKWTERAMGNCTLSLPQEHSGRGPLASAVANSQSFPKGAEAQISSSKRNGFSRIGS